MVQEKWVLGTIVVAGDNRKVGRRSG